MLVSKRSKFFYLGWELSRYCGERLYIWKDLANGFLVKTSYPNPPKWRYDGDIRQNEN